jgi:hypothetical protein
LNIAFEKQLFESLISAGSSPETSFLNLLTALAVMPMAAFTTLAVLGGGAGTPPAWMKPGKKGAVDDTQEQLDMLSSGIDRLAADVNQSKATRPVSSYTPAVVQHVMVPVPAQQPAMPQPEPSPSTVDDLDFDALANRVARESAPDVSSPTSYNEPVIRGFDLESSEDA